MNSTAQHEFSDDLTLGEVAAVAWANKVPILLAGLAGAIVAIGASYLIRPVFRAEVLTALAAEDRASFGALAQFGGLAELAGASLGPQSNRAAAIATLKSRLLTQAFIEDRKLMPVLFASNWDAEQGRWKSDDPDKQPTAWDAVRSFDRIRVVQDDRKTGLVTLAIEWYDAAQAADWANELVRRVNAKLQQDNIAEGEKTIAYLEKQLAGASSVEVRQALYGLIESETKKVAVAHAREEFGFKVIDPAVPPKRRVRPDRKFMAVTGGLVGLLAAMFWFLFRRAQAIA